MVKIRTHILIFLLFISVAGIGSYLDFLVENDWLTDFQKCFIVSVGLAYIIFLLIKMIHK